MLQHLLFRLLMRNPWLAGLFMTFLGVMVLGAAGQEIWKFYTLKDATPVRGEAISVRSLGSGSDASIDISVAWPERPKEAPSPLRASGKRTRGRAKEPPAPPQVPDQDVQMLHRAPKAPVAVRREGNSVTVQASALKEGDSVDLLLSERDKSVILANERPTGGLWERMGFALFGLAFVIAGVGAIVFRRKLSEQVEA